MSRNDIVQSLDPDATEADMPVWYAHRWPAKEKPTRYTAEQAIQEIFRDQYLSPDLDWKRPYGKPSRLWVEWAKEAIKELT